MQRRKALRIPLIHHFEVRNLASDAVLGYLANITSRGMMLLTAGPPDHDDVRRLLPVLLMVRDVTATHAISLTARIVWARPDDGTSGLHAMGLEFQDVSAATRAVLKAVIREFGSEFGRPPPPHLRRTRRFVLQL
jgi:c-di-GMP-binding flagellar brake protein YcgR